MKLRFPIGYEPQTLFTQGVIVAKDVVLRIEQGYDEYSKLIKEWFGHVKDANNTCVKLHSAKLSKSLYISCVNKTISIGTSYFSTYPGGVPSRYVMSSLKSEDALTTTTVVPEDVQLPVKSYRIFHIVSTDDMPANGKEHQQREYVATVQAQSLQEAFVLSQNGIHTPCWHEHARSTMVGDVIEVDYTCYLVAGMGFEQIPGLRYDADGNQELSEADLEAYEDNILAKAMEGRKLDE